MLYFGEYSKILTYYWHLFMKNSTALSVVTDSIKKIFISSSSYCKYIGSEIFWETSLVNIISSFGNFLKKNTSELLANSGKYFVI